MRELSPTMLAGARSVFVGRRREIERLDALWMAVKGHRRQVVMVGGEPGVGKTRLVAEVATALKRNGATVVSGSCRPDPKLPFGPSVAILEQAFTQVSCPLVVVLEDLHLASDSTLDMLARVIECTAGGRLLILATCRTTVPDRSDSVTFALADLQRLEGVGRIDLQGLDTQEVYEYLVHGAGVPWRVARAAAPAMHDQTGGNPFFLQEYWHHLAAHGGFAAVNAAPSRAPQSIQDALARRLATFPPRAAQVLRVAAIAGEVIDPLVLIGACEFSADVVLDGLDFCTRSGLLVPDAAAGCFRFAHALARQAVIDQMPSTTRALAHARIAQFLERRAREDDPGLALQQTERTVKHSAASQGIGHRRALPRIDADSSFDPVLTPWPCGLTGREVEVLRLVADGLSNREVGECLFISANTAANHVRSILIKTNAPNRTKAAVFASEQGLL